MDEVNTGELYEGEFSKTVECKQCGTEFETNITDEGPYYCSATCATFNSVIRSSGRHPWGCDNVNHPAHYTDGKIECIDYIQDKLTDEEFRGYIKGNVLKYITREKHKNGDEDIKKAQWYLNKLVEEIGG